MRSILFSLILLVGVLSAQSQLYEDAYRKAMADGKVSKDEREMLDLLQKSLGLEEDEILEIQRRVAGTTEVSIGLSRTGRRRVIAQNMLYGNGLYGWALPYVLGVESGSVYAGMQLLAITGGFYFSWQYTKNMDIPLARATFQNAGSGLGLASAYPLVMLIGPDRWEEFDPEAKILLTYMMVSVPVGIGMGDRLYRQWRPSDGQALAITSAGGLASFNALMGHLLVTAEEGPKDEENWLRLNSLLLYGGYLGGSYLGWRQFSNESLTMGDAYFMSLGSLLGSIMGLELVLITEPDYKPLLMTLLLSIDGVTYAAYKLGSGFDLTTGETAIVGLGSFAAYTAFRGITYILDLDQSSKGLMVGDIISYMTGAYLTFRALEPQREIASAHNQSFRLAVSPTILTAGQHPVPALGVNIQF
ncbi:MAG: hypothetical protein ACETWG_04020 [Candidatus Neomarinimicrobiota bacterium]